MALSVPIDFKRTRYRTTKWGYNWKCLGVCSIRVLNNHGQSLLCATTVVHNEKLIALGNFVWKDEKEETYTRWSKLEILFQLIQFKWLGQMARSLHVWTGKHLIAIRNVRTVQSYYYCWSEAVVDIAQKLTSVEGHTQKPNKYILG